MVASHADDAFGAERAASGNLQTVRTFTGQKSDASGLMYYNARYYDPALGTFISPDTIVPNPNLAIDYNRYTYARANPLRILDPSGNNPACSILMGPTPANALLAVGCQVAFAIVRAATLYGPQAVQVGQQWADKGSAMWDATRTAWDSAWDASNTWLQAQVGNPTQPQNVPQSGGGGNTGDPGGIDPNQFKFAERVVRNLAYNTDSVWGRYQKHVTGKDYEEVWNLSLGRRVHLK